jgi:hypothetical protein
VVLLSPENPRDLLDRTPADMGGDDQSGPIGDHACDRIGTAEPEYSANHGRTPFELRVAHHVCVETDFLSINQWFWSA